MTRLTLPAASLLIAALSWTSAFAGPVGDFETRMRAAYAPYRAALFATNAAKPDEAGRAVATFRNAWAALGAGAVPPQYADDARYTDTLKAVAAIADKAATEIGAGQLGPAHETLEAIRDEIGNLHDRNGIVGFSDRMNAYHARMELLLGDSAKIDAAALTKVAGDVAVLAFLAEDIVRHPPTEAASDPSFTALTSDLMKSLDAVTSALAKADAAAVKAALAGLKAPYSKLFLKFG